MEPTQGKVLRFNKPKRFTLEEARNVLPKVKEITEHSVEELSPILAELKRSDLILEEKEELETQLRIKANEWAEEISHIGAVVKGLWLVDFDSGNGYYCWQYDEPNIDYFHSYNEGFSGRLPIQ